VSLRHYAAVEAAVGVLGGVMPWLIALCGPVFGVAYRALGDHPVSYNLLQFAVCGAVLLVPAILMGTTLPLVTAVLVRARDDVGVAGGRLYAVNTIGGALGAAACGFWLLPGLGMRTTGFLAAAVNLTIAAVAWLLAPQLEFGEHGVREQRDPDDADGEEQSGNTVRTVDPDDARRCRGHFADQTDEATRQRRHLAKHVQAVDALGDVRGQPTVKVAIAKARHLGEEAQA